MLLLSRKRIPGWRSVRLSALWLALSAASGVLAAQEEDGPAAAAANPTEQLGRLITIPAPLTTAAEQRVRRAATGLIEEAMRQRRQPVLIFEIAPGHREKGESIDLAEFLVSLTGAKTVAYGPQGIRGHGVLLALACDHIALGPDTEIGDAGADEETIGPALRDQYWEIASRRRKSIPKAIVLGMLDPALEVWQIETEVSREFVLGDELEQRREERAFRVPEQPLKPAGEPGRFSAEQAKSVGIENAYVAADRLALMRALGLPRSAALEDLSGEGGWRAVRVDVRGPMTDKLAAQTQGVIEKELAAGANFICLSIDSPGGSPEGSLALANFLTGPALDGRRTVAYIDDAARADAAILALACDEIVMRRGAVLGGEGAWQVPEADVAVTVAAIKPVAQARLRSWSLPAGIVDASLKVSRYLNREDGRIEYFCDAELAEQADAEAWQQGDVIKPAGQLFVADAGEAADWGLATHAVDSFQEFRTLYGLENDPRLVEPGWADSFIEALGSSGVAWFLLVMGLVALWTELQQPGIGIAGFIAALCFLVFFWAKFLGGTAGWLEALLFVVGVAFVLVEVFVLPGFGIFGLGGGLMMIISLILASQTLHQWPQNGYQYGQVSQSFLVVAGAGITAFVAVSMLNRYLPHTPALTLAPPSTEEQAAIARREALADFSDLVGADGQTTTPLTPAGKARFGDRLVDVVASGEFLERGTRVRVVEAYGNRVVVKSVG
jgi:membrane-bound ClpP family serine protease